MPWYSNRKPYYQLGKSLIAFFKEPIRFLKTGSSIESEFEKPYLDNSYNDLQFSWLLPAWEWNWPNFGGGVPTFNSCIQVVSDFCQVLARATTDHGVHNVAVVGGWGSNDYGARLHCGKGSLGCGQAENLVAGFVGTPLPTGWVKHESRDTCTESFDVDYMWTWKRPSLCGGPAIDKSCKGKFRVACVPCASADPLAWVVLPPEAVAGAADLAIEVSGGESTYLWSVPSGNATFDEAITADVHNTLDIDNDACGTVQVQVTSCGESLTGDIRITDAGEWCVAAGDESCHGVGGDGNWVSGAIWRDNDSRWRVTETYSPLGIGATHCNYAPCEPGLSARTCQENCTIGACDTDVGCDQCFDASIDKIWRSTGTSVGCNLGFTSPCCQQTGVAACQTYCTCVKEGTRIVEEWKCAGC